MILDYFYHRLPPYSDTSSSCVRGSFKDSEQACNDSYDLFQTTYTLKTGGTAK